MTETERLRRVVMGCRSPWDVAGVDALITRCERARKQPARLDDNCRGLLALADSFLASPAGTPLAERRWWLLRLAAIALENKTENRIQSLFKSESRSCL